MLDRTIAPEVFPVRADFNLPKIDKCRLGNGILVHSILSGSQDALKIEWIFNGGSWSQNHAGASYFCTKLLSAGTRLHSAQSIEQTIASWGAHLELESNHERNTIGIYILPKYLKNVLPLIFELLTDSIFPEEEIENIKRTTKQNIEVNEQKNSFLASNKFKECLFGCMHPYGRVLNAHVIESIHQKPIEAFYSQTFKISNCEIFVSGNTSLDIFALLNEYFGKSNWGNPSSEPVLNSYTFTYEPSKVLIEKPQSLQSSIRIGKPTIPITHPDYFAFTVLVEILGGYFGSRLMKNIREDKGYTYGISSNMVSLKYATYLVIGTDVNVQNTQNTIEETYKEITKLQNNIVSDTELDQVKNYILGSFQNSVNTPFAIADKYKTIYYFGLNDDFYQQYLNAVMSVKAQHLQELAIAYFDLHTFTQVVAGKV